MRRRRAAFAGAFAMVIGLGAAPAAHASGDRDWDWDRGRGFKIEEATIADIQHAIQRRQVTTTDVVKLYLERIKAYNGTCVSEPQGILGPITMIPHAGKVNALITLNLRPKHRVAWGFDARKARSQTDPADNDPRMPDALETAARLDQQFARTGRLAGPLHGAVFSIKDQYDTFDLRTTSGADAFWANDRPPDDATVVARLRAAGAIILAKANMDEYAGGDARSSWGGTGCNPYDTERDPGGSSGGSAVSVATNMVTCSIAEETGGSVVKPARWNNVVGLVPTRELVSADGMIQRGLNTRVGPMCRTVQDTARVLSAYAGFDPKDELTAFSNGRLPERPYESYTGSRRLFGYRIGVIREYMDKDLFTPADAESIDIVDRAVGELRRLGATVVDPGPKGALFQSCVDRFVPKWLNQQFTPQWPALFPPGGDHNATLLDLFFDTSKVPHTAAGRPSIRNIGGTGSDAGDARYNLNAYIRERGDANIKSLTDLITKANFWTDPVLVNRKASLESADRALTLATASALQAKHTMQTVVHQCFAELDLDAVVYPSGNIPPAVLTAVQEPTVNDRGSNWTAISSRGFPALTVPAGFTTRVHDRGPDGQLLAPKPARLPVGVDFLALPFREHTLFDIAAAYEAATHHRSPPPEFGPLDRR
ncbi:amidase [Solirubrobacter sp. CPCC 204708]|uniref:Amidase n=1 Tax=Solirubrobacter deserti TaxID=2282478 RepID=A0ABT4RES5_9ACTN|nr:amidase [Solirubrobacter deserti]MBE2316116.1 amidase [Solirubrobacter deserti]MDA0136866.1 amidase [Solirubrobacter deserti]